MTWAVTGSTSFALQGMPVQPDDIDIQTDEAGAYLIERLFANEVTRPVRFSSGDRVRSYFGALRIEGVIVEIMGDLQKRLDDGTWEEPVEVEQYLEFVELDGIPIPVLSLEYECGAYERLGRMDRAQQLREWLERRG